MKKTKEQQNLFESQILAGHKLIKVTPDAIWFGEKVCVTHDFMRDKVTGEMFQQYKDWVKSLLKAGDNAIFSEKVLVKT